MLIDRWCTTAHSLNVQCTVRPYCRLGHEVEKKSPNATACSLCEESFGSVRELVTHRQLHPQFKHHVCRRCNKEFETVIDLRNHRYASGAVSYVCLTVVASTSSFRKEECTKRRRNRGNSSAGHQSTSTRNSSLSIVKSSIPGVEDALKALSAIQNNTNSDSSIDVCQSDKANKVTSESYEGRGTVGCALCQRTFTLKVLLRRHYVSAHGYKPGGKTPKLIRENTDMKWLKSVLVHSWTTHVYTQYSIYTFFSQSSWARRSLTPPPLVLLMTIPSTLSTAVSAH